MLSPPDGATRDALNALNYYSTKPLRGQQPKRLSVRKRPAYPQRSLFFAAPALPAAKPPRRFFEDRRGRFRVYWVYCCALGDWLVYFCLAWLTLF
jgi:hypothetical protein